MTRAWLAPALAFAWGALEATVFFIVPDVLLSWIGLRRTKLALGAALAATAGAVLGGTVMYALGQRSPDTSRDLLVAVPGIDAGLVESARAQLDRHGPSAIFLGVAFGRPFKIYAVESGAAGRSLAPFLAVSALARALRFVASALLARLATLALARWTRRRPWIETTLWAGFWLGFYAFYFAAFGW